jgi:hypothetical protein
MVARGLPGRRTAHYCAAGGFGAVGVDLLVADRQPADAQPAPLRRQGVGRLNYAVFDVGVELQQRGDEGVTLRAAACGLPDVAG